MATREPRVVTTLDLSDGDEACAAAMGRAAAQGTGFFLLTGHGIPQETLVRRITQR